MAIQGQISMRTPADHQFALATRHRVADQWVVFQHIQRRDNFMNALAGAFDIMCGEVIEDALKIVGYLCSQFDARHA